MYGHCLVLSASSIGVVTILTVFSVQHSFRATTRIHLLSARTPNVLRSLRETSMHKRISLTPIDFVYIGNAKTAFSVVQHVLHGANPSRLGKHMLIYLPQMQ